MCLWLHAQPIHTHLIVSEYQQQSFGHSQKWGLRVYTREHRANVENAVGCVIKFTNLQEYTWVFFQLLQFHFLSGLSLFWFCLLPASHQTSQLFLFLTWVVTWMSPDCLLHTYSLVYSSIGRYVNIYSHTQLSWMYGHLLIVTQVCITKW